MSLKRVITEFGTGNDLHGGDYTKAAVRAVQDAIHHSSLSLIRSLGIDSRTMQVAVTIGVQQPDRVQRRDGQGGAAARPGHGQRRQGRSRRAGRGGRRCRDHRQRGRDGAPRPALTGAGIPPGMLYFEDIAAGQTYRSPSLRIDAAAITAFAAEFDPQPFHLDDAAARELAVRGAGGERLAHRGADDETVPVERFPAGRRHPRGRRRIAVAPGRAPRRRAARRDRGARNPVLAVAPAPGSRQNPHHDAEPGRRPGPDLHADAVRRSPAADR